MPGLHVAIDLTGLADAPDPVLRESLQVRFAAALTHHAPEVDFTVLTRPTTPAALASLEAPNVRHVALAEPGNFRYLAQFGPRLIRRVRRSRIGGSLGWLSRPRSGLLGARRGRLARLGVHVAFRPFTNSGVRDAAVPTVVAIHDLQHVSHPHLLTSAERQARSQAWDAIGREAVTLVCSTPSLRQVASGRAGMRVQRALTLFPGRLLVPAPEPPSAVATTLARHHLEERRFFLVAADFERRHNHEVVLTALAMVGARLAGSTIRLVCGGGPDEGAATFASIAQQMGLGGRVAFLGPLAREETSALIQGCRGVIVGSLYETVGEIAIEAMQRGRPLLCSKIPGLSELIGSAALTFDPHRPAELADAVSRIEAEPMLADHLGQLGREQAARLDDAQSVARAYLDVFREASTTCPVSP